MSTNKKTNMNVHRSVKPIIELITGLEQNLVKNLLTLLTHEGEITPEILRLKNEVSILLGQTLEALRPIRSKIERELVKVNRDYLSS